ncbi:MAG TPA: NAD(P)/FAD-dependent oxidoreductase, partial [Jatrophihabitantaceae bacterium]|nr:NAD(P)/FAD-dependent oxidoreductase [Jatrophihabitantaceae bacterium]
MGHVHEAIVVGAGFGGMGAAIQLKRQGMDDIVMLERESDLGGTWHVNRYPGLAVDIPSVTYSYSFEPNPYWSRFFAPGPELKRYADHVADKYDLRRLMRFDTVVERAVWDERAQQWDVHTRDGDVISARFLLTATGFLSQPRMPDIPGVETFAGKVMHTAAWDHDYDLTGRRAAVIGTGATAVQLIPELAKIVDQLTVYQRTAIWVTPKSDGPIPRRVQALFARLPLSQRAARLASTSVLELLMVSAVLHYRQVNFVNRAAERWSTKHLHRQVADPELRRKLTPDYSFGCKRPTLSNSYYRTFTRDNVQLETTPIERIEPDGVVTTDGTKTEIDTLVLATGFDIWQQNFPAIELVGREGRNLGEWWRKTRFQAYEGVAAPYFPNYLTLASPYSYSGLSYFTTIESQMRHMRRLFGEMSRRGARTFEVSEAANARFLDRVTRKLGSSVFVLGSCSTARSYYFNQHG